MWETLKYKFEKYPARMDVASKMVELGLRIDEDHKIYCDDLKISDMALAKVAGVERKAIRSTVEFILKDKELSTIFKNILPAGTLLKNIAKNLGLGAIEIETSNENIGILAFASKLISKEKISIRQAYASDTALEEAPTLTIITEKPIPSNLINEFLKIKGVTRVSIY
ncbi:MAG: amino acid-binding protein [Methanobrevibacter sp.]|jgi:predicted regulator of amino acid metabolism with ACT domain|nr:amino acid-binding protein [Methanobrevibacter sp.]